MSFSRSLSFSSSFEFAAIIFFSVTFSTYWKAKNEKVGNSEKFQRTKFFGVQNFGSFVRRFFFIGVLFPYRKKLRQTKISTKKIFPMDKISAVLYDEFFGVLFPHAP